MVLSRDDILKTEDLERRTVAVPEWGGEVLVRALTGTERDDYEASCMTERPRYDAKGRPVRGQTEMVRTLANVRAKLVARCAIDEDGNRLFTDLDIGVLGGKSASALDRVFEVCAELSRLTEQDIDELAGNSGGAQSAGSISA